VGRIPIYLLDTNLPENDPTGREITAQLYGGDDDMRIRQEILLGIGGIRALAALGIQPTVCHMNEGHSAFLALERIGSVMAASGCSFAQAREAVTAGNVFTTHTPVPAGNDVFNGDLVDRYFASYYPTLGLSREEFLGLGRTNPADRREGFCMTTLAIRLSSYRNGVSQLHGEVSRNMWKDLWPGTPLDEVPISSITNGVHTRSWVSNDLASLLDRYLGPRWTIFSSYQDVWDRVEQIPDEELWRTHERRRERLVAFARRRLREQLVRRGALHSEISQAEEALDPDALTIGFARRFATYKRSTLLFRDMERLSRLLTNRKEPVQIIFAGKAHPRDMVAKELIRAIIHHARREELRRRIIFIEDYDINVARYLVQGCDIWLNTPLRPMEASGTSGMKAAMNAVLNMSIPDGWWPEAYDGKNGWQIGKGERYVSEDEQNEVESHAIYGILEKEAVPTFYTRGSDGLPREWIAMMKRTMRTVAPRFSTNRMVQDYAVKCYLPAHQRWQDLAGENLVKARQLADWKRSLAEQWGRVSVRRIEASPEGVVPVGRNVEIKAWVQLGSISPNEVRVEMCYGPLEPEGDLREKQILPMSWEGQDGEGVHRFGASIQFRASGGQGLALRILPWHEDVPSPFDTGLIRWA
jgi:starch phosphorylase